MKKSFTGMDIFVITQEIQSLVGSFLIKVKSISSMEFILVFESNKIRKRLLISVGKWLFITNKIDTISNEKNEFVKILKKHLLNRKVTSVSQHEFDRIIEIQFGEYTLILEYFSRGNIILVKDSIIVQPLYVQSWKHRKIKHGMQYIYPPAQSNPKLLSFDDFSKFIDCSSRSDIVRILAMDMGFHGLYAEEICLRANVNKNKRNLTEDEKKRLYDTIHSIFNEKREPQIIYDNNGNMIDVVPVKMMIYEGYKKDRFSTLNESIEQFHIWISDYEKKKKLIEETEKKIKKYEYLIEQYKKDILNFEEEINRYKQYGDLIYQHYNEIESMIRKTTDDEIKITLDGTELILNKNRDVNGNAIYYYNLSKKAKKKLQDTKIAIDKLIAKIDTIEQEKKRIVKNEKKEKTKIFWFEKYKWFISSENELVICGRDVKSNERVVKRHLGNNDIYAHADIHGAPSVVIRGNKEKTIREGCEFALIHSKAWNAKIGSGDAYWVTSEQVTKKISKHQFVPRGAFIITGKRNYYRNLKLVTAIGEIEYKGYKKVMCGPLSAMKKHSSRYIVFEPGDMKKDIFARDVSRIFNIDVDTIMRILPPGNVNVVSVVGIDYT